jgi:ribosomal protein S18 acetylase RimI-like enzyme
LHVARVCAQQSFGGASRRAGISLGIRLHADRCCGHQEIGETRFLQVGSMKTREATSADRTAIIALWMRCALTRPWNDLVGHDGHRGSTYYVGVAPELRRKGVGRALMTAVEDWLRARGVGKLNLLVRRENSDVVRFYEELGYGDQGVVALGKRLDGRPDRSTGE